MFRKRHGRFGACPPYSFLGHEFVKFIIHARIMCYGPDASLDCTASAIDRLTMTFYLEPGLGRLTHHEFDFVHTVSPRLTIHADLDDLCSIKLILPHGLDDFILSVGVDILRVNDILPYAHFRSGPELASHAADNDAGVNNLRTRDPSLLNCLAEGSVSIVSVVTHV